jgi:large subunit ribosomal protein L4
MTLDVVNAENEKVGSIELDDAVIGGPVRSHLVWEAVVSENAAARPGTHATKNRARVSGSGRKPWRQKGTGRARVGEIRNPLWRKGGTVFGPQPRRYAYAIPRKVTRAALAAALVQKLCDGAVLVVDQLGATEGRTQAMASWLGRLGVTGKALVVDVKPDDDARRATRNLAEARLVATGRLTARDVADAGRLVVTRAAAERLGAVLAGGTGPAGRESVAAGENAEP